MLRYHPWVFSGAIGHINGKAEEGDTVCVRSADGEPLGVGHWQEGSIAVRLLEFNMASLPQDLWQQRIAAAYRMRQTLGLISEQNNTYRLVHGEGDFLPGLIIDIYGDTAVMQAHSAGMHKARKEIAAATMAAVEGLRNVYYKSESTLPLKKHFIDIEDGYLIAADQQTTQAEETHWARENGLEFKIDWLHGQKTGFFVDQRENRGLLERYAYGRRVLNMFCYTGGFSVYALRGGAEHVCSVDSSEKAIELVRENVERNFKHCTRHEAVSADAFSFLSTAQERQKKEGEAKYDLIVLDPPAFAKHRGAIRNALQGYKRLNAKAIEQIASGGILFTFSCSQAVDKEMFRLAVFSAAAMTGRKVRILHQLTQPQDHPVNIYQPEGEYLKGLVLYVE